MGIQYCGGGGTQAETIISHLGLPSGCRLRSRFSEFEIDVGEAERKTKEEFELKSLNAEKDMTIEKEGIGCKLNGLVCMKVQYDMGWTKRSSGNRYDSQSGHCHIVGYNTQKVIGTFVYCKVCCTCAAAEKYGMDPEDHNCARNYEGASKSMESDAILRMCIDAPNHGYYITVIVSDDDTNMRAHLKHKKSHLASDKGKLPVSRNETMSLFYII
jgi:hypothetical protein